MRSLLLLLLLTTSVCADHVYWTQTQGYDVGNTLQTQLKKVYVDVSGNWVNIYDREPCMLIMAPDKEYAVGYFRVTVDVVPLGKSKKVCSLSEPFLVDHPIGATRVRWMFQRAVAGSDGLTFLGNTFFPSHTPIPWRNQGSSWVYGLHGAREGHTRIPLGSYQPAPISIEHHAVCAYDVGRFKLRFDRTLPTHNPGVSKLAIKNISMLLWKAEDPREPYWYDVTLDSRASHTHEMIVAVQRRGDANLDGRVDGLDVNAFMQAVNRPNDYQDRFWGVDAQFNCDMNGDGAVDGLDVDPFIRAIFNPSSVADYWDSINYD